MEWRRTPQKIEAMISWLQLKDFESIKGFLGLTCYYRRFIKDYGNIPSLS